MDFVFNLIVGFFSAIIPESILSSDNVEYFLGELRTFVLLGFFLFLFSIILGIIGVVNVVKKTKGLTGVRAGWVLLMVCNPLVGFFVWFLWGKYRIQRLVIVDAPENIVEPVSNSSRMDNVNKNDKDTVVNSISGNTV